MEMTVFEGSCLQRMASLTGRWQGLTLVALRALSRDQSGLVRTLGRDHLELGRITKSGIMTPVNTFSSLSPPICRLGPLPCAQVLRTDFFLLQPNDCFGSL